MATSRAWLDLGEGFLANPYSRYAQMREQASVLRVQQPTGLETWLVTRHEEAHAALTDRHLSRDCHRLDQALRSRGIPIGDRGGRGLWHNVLNCDPPDHTRLRVLVGEAFTPRRIGELRPCLGEIADRLLDPIAPRGEADLIEAFAVPLPVRVVCELLGVPVEDRDDLRTWAADMLTPPLTAKAFLRRAAGMHATWRYLTDLVGRRRPAVRAGRPSEEQPDLVSALIAAGEVGRWLDERELADLLTLLLVAGYETTVNLIGNGMLALLRHPHQLRLLRERPELLGPAIEELLRYDGPVQQTPLRVAIEDVRIGDVVVPAGSLVSVLIAAADRDPERFPGPDGLDVARAPNPHVAFGHGIRSCPGAPLARLEAQVAIETLLRRLPDLELAVPAAQLRWRGSVVRGLTALPVRF
jgi:cytochrome P450